MTEKQAAQRGQEASCRSAIRVVKTNMPSKPAAQARLVRAAAHDKAFSKCTGVPQSVAREFVNADKEHPMATKGKMAALFGGKESKAEEAREKKAFPGRKAYAAAERKYEGEKRAGVGAAKRGFGAVRKG